jgi:hypothetical protein
MRPQARTVAQIRQDWPDRARPAPGLIRFPSVMLFQLAANRA